MSWYNRKIAVHQVGCHGCGNLVTIEPNEWMKVRSSPGAWRCSDCEKHPDIDQEAEDYLVQRDRSVGSEYLLRSRYQQVWI